MKTPTAFKLLLVATFVYTSPNMGFSSRGDLSAKLEESTLSSTMSEDGHATAYWSGTSDMVFRALEAGSAGNDIVVSILHPNTASATMTDSVIENSFIIYVATDEYGNQITSTGEVANYIQAIIALVSVSGSDFYSTDPAPLGTFYLSGGWD